MDLLADCFILILFCISLGFLINAYIDTGSMKYAYACWLHLLATTLFIASSR